MANFDFDEINKLIIVLAPDIEVTVQELWNAIADFQYNIENLDLDIIATSSGKQDLGGGVSVGITLELTNGWRVQFEARGTPTICTVSGGNLVAQTGGTSYFPLAYSTNVLATRSVSSSATTQDIGSIQYSSFQNAVWIDTINGVSGTEFNKGTPENPVDNLADAISIATTRGFEKINFIKDLVVGATDNIDEYELTGQATTKSTLTLTLGCSTIRSEFFNTRITGDAEGAIIVTECDIDGLVDVGGTTTETIIDKCLFNMSGSSSVSLSSTATEFIHIIDSWSGIAGSSSPILNYNGTIAGVTLRNYSGGIKITNYTGGQESSYDFESGTVEFDSSCTDGTVVVRGDVDIIDNSAGTFTVIDKTTATLVDISITEIPTILSIVEQLQEYTVNKMTIDTTSRTPAVYLQIWDDAGTSVLYEHRLTTTSDGDPTVDEDGIANRGTQE